MKGGYSDILLLSAVHYNITKGEEKMEKTAKRISLVVAALSVVVILFLTVAIALSVREVEALEWQETTYIVMEGDRIWTIAKTYCPEWYSLEEYIEMLYKRNPGLSALIYPGQEITVYELD